MRFGIVILPEYRWAQAREYWMRAESYGFDHAWTYDHLSWRTLADGPWFATIPTLTAAATVTSRIRLGTLVASPNFRHPVPFSKELLTLDDISDGRLLLGIGAGGTGFDATVLGGEVLAPRARADRLEEFVGALDQLLREPVSDFSGQLYTAVDARSIPGCVQQPRVPFVIAANGPRMMRLAVEQGKGWVTTGTFGGDDGVDAWWSEIAELASRFNDVLAAAGKAPDALDRYLSVDACDVPALSSVECFNDYAGRAADLGFTDMIIHWPRPDGVYAARESVLEAVAAEIS